MERDSIDRKYALAKIDAQVTKTFLNSCDAQQRETNSFPSLAKELVQAQEHDNSSFAFAHTFVVAGIACFVCVLFESGLSIGNPRSRQPRSTTMATSTLVAIRCHIGGRPAHSHTLTRGGASDSWCPRCCHSLPRASLCLSRCACGHYTRCFDRMSLFYRAARCILVNAPLNPLLHTLVHTLHAPILGRLSYE